MTVVCRGVHCFCKMLQASPGPLLYTSQSGNEPWVFAKNLIRIIFGEPQQGGSEIGSGFVSRVPSIWVL